MTLGDLSAADLPCVLLQRAQLVAEKIMLVDTRFWLRLATRNDTAGSAEDKHKLQVRRSGQRARRFGRLAAPQAQTLSPGFKPPVCDKPGARLCFCPRASPFIF